MVGIFLLLISGSFLSEGLSRVGLDNAMVSQCMAEGSEGFWLPSVDTPGTPDRTNYLPFGYWIESQWYALFGGHSFLVDKIYSVFIFLVLGLLIVLIWKQIGQSPRTGWLPLVCWLTIPIVSWSATNNLMESTMTVFILLSVVFLLKALRQFKVQNSKFTIYIWTVLAALMMELAFLVKGIAGLFPVFLPLLYWLMVERKQALKHSVISTVLILLVWTVTLFVVAVISPDVYHRLSDYMHLQLPHIYVVYLLAVQSLIPIAVFIVISLIRIKKRPIYRYLFFWRHKKKITAEQELVSRYGWLFFVFALVGVVPIMFSLKQKDFHLIPLLPFFAISMACFVYNLVSDWLENIGNVARYVLAGLAVALWGCGVVLNLNSINKISSDHILLGDMRLILPNLAEGETITVASEIMDSPEVAEYFYRYKHVLFEEHQTLKHSLAMYDLSNRNLIDTAYVKVEMPTMQYTLYELKIEN